MKKNLFVLLIIVLLSSTVLFAVGGDIQVTCKPGFRVYLDGKFVGVTNLKEDGKYLTKISKGIHKIVIKKAGFLSKKFKISVKYKSIKEITVGKMTKKESILRSESIIMNSDDVKTMLIKKGFYDSVLNPSGGYLNKFQSKDINGDKVVVDNAAGLMWYPLQSDKAMRYSNVQAWINEFNRKNYAGYNDWRVPTLEEVASLLEESKKSNGLSIEPVFSSKAYLIWTIDKTVGNMTMDMYGFSKDNNNISLYRGDSDAKQKMFVVDFILNSRITYMGSNSEAWIRPVRTLE